MVTSSSKGGKKGKKRGGKASAASSGEEKAGEGKTGGGGRKVHISNRRGTFVDADGDPRWFNNPQYRLFVERETECYVSLMQKDRRMLRHAA